MIKQELKVRIVEEIKRTAPHYASAAKQATALSISASQLSRIKSGDLENVLSDGKWMGIARRLDISINPNTRWNTAKTPVFQFIFAQLANCQQHSLSGLLCDDADIGKTFSAKAYAKENKNAVYIDCSQTKSKQKLIRKIAQEFGVDNAGRYADVYEDLCYYLRSIEMPIVILDEAGDLDYAAFLELKALWNATERSCGWYMMGADGLKAKIERHKGLKKVGYVEVFSRFGNRYQKIVPNGTEEQKQFINQQVMLIGTANGVSDVRSLIAKADGSLRRVAIEVNKTATA